MGSPERSHCVFIICMLIVLTNCLVYGLPLQGSDDRTTGYGEAPEAQLNDQGSDNTPREPVRSEGHTNAGESDLLIPEGQMFPANMPPPPPGAMNDDGGQIVRQNTGSEYSPDKVAPYIGADVNANVGVPPQNGGQMFPPNMPAPPPGAMNDGGMPPQYTPGAFPAQSNQGMSPPPPEKPVLPISGNMFPPNMPAPPPGAMNDGGMPRQYASGAFPAQSNQGMSPPPPEKPILPISGNMFPPNMPAPPPGAMNDGGMPPQYTPGAFPAQSNQGLFPPNMPPPPPGAFNDASAGSAFVSQYPVPPTMKHRQFVPAVNPNDAEADPNYSSGNQVPDLTNPPAGGQNPASSLSQVVPDPKGQSVSNVPSSQDDAIAKMYPDDQTVAVAYTPSRAPSPNQDNYAGNTNHSTDILPESNKPLSSGVSSNQDYPPNTESNQAVTDDTMYHGEAEQGGDRETSAFKSGGENLPSYESSDGVEKSVSDYSFMGWLSAIDESFSSVSIQETIEEVEQGADDETGQVQPVEESLLSYESRDDGEESVSDYSFMDMFSDSENFFKTVSGSESIEDESSYFSNLDWILSDGEYAERESDFDERPQEDNVENMRVEESNFPIEVEEVQPGGSTLILYCIPALILSLLVVLAWRNYRGKIRVVSIPAERNYYTGHSDTATKEQSEPMLAAEERENTY